MLSMVLCSNAVVRQNTKTHLEELMKEKEHLTSKYKAMEEGIKLMLDLIGLEPEERPADQPVQPDAVVEKCQSS
jgi:hypothetical protein